MPINWLSERNIERNEYIETHQEITPLEINQTSFRTEKEHRDPQRKENSELPLSNYSV